MPVYTKSGRLRYTSALLRPTIAIPFTKWGTLHNGGMDYQRITAGFHQTSRQSTVTESGRKGGERHFKVMEPVVPVSWYDEAARLIGKVDSVTSRLGGELKGPDFSGLGPKSVAPKKQTATQLRKNREALEQEFPRLSEEIIDLLAVASQPDSGGKIILPERTVVKRLIRSLLFCELRHVTSRIGNNEKINQLAEELAEFHARLLVLGKPFEFATALHRFLDYARPRDETIGDLRKNEKTAPKDTDSKIQRRLNTLKEKKHRLEDDEKRYRKRVEGNNTNKLSKLVHNKLLKKTMAQKRSTDNELYIIEESTCKSIGERASKQESVLLEDLRRIFHSAKSGGELFRTFIAKDVSPKGGIDNWLPLLAQLRQKSVELDCDDNRREGWAGECLAPYPDLAVHPERKKEILRLTEHKMRAEILSKDLLDLAAIHKPNHSGERGRKLVGEGSNNVSVLLAGELESGNQIEKWMGGKQKKYDLVLASWLRETRSALQIEQKWVRDQRDLLEEDVDDLLLNLREHIAKIEGMDPEQLARLKKAIEKIGVERVTPGGKIIESLSTLDASEREVILSFLERLRTDMRTLCNLVKNDSTRNLTDLLKELETSLNSNGEKSLFDLKENRETRKAMLTRVQYSLNWMKCLGVETNNHAKFWLYLLDKTRDWDELQRKDEQISKQVQTCESAMDSCFDDKAKSLLTSLSISTDGKVSQWHEDSWNAVRNMIDLNLTSMEQFGTYYKRLSKIGGEFDSALFSKRDEEGMNKFLKFGRKVARTLLPSLYTLDGAIIDQQRKKAKVDDGRTGFTRKAKKSWAWVRAKLAGIEPKTQAHFYDVSLAGGKQNIKTFEIGESNKFVEGLLSRLELKYNYEDFSKMELPAVGVVLKLIQDDEKLVEHVLSDLPIYDEGMLTSLELNAEEKVELNLNIKKTEALKLYTKLRGLSVDDNLLSFITDSTLRMDLAAQKSWEDRLRIFEERDQSWNKEQYKVVRFIYDFVTSAQRLKSSMIDGVLLRMIELCAPDTLDLPRYARLSAKEANLLRQKESGWKQVEKQLYEDLRKHESRLGKASRYILGELKNGNIDDLNKEYLTEEKVYEVVTSLARNWPEDVAKEQRRLDSKQAKAKGASLHDATLQATTFRMMSQLIRRGSQLGPEDSQQIPYLDLEGYARLRKGSSAAKRLADVQTDLARLRFGIDRLKADVREKMLTHGYSGQDTGETLDELIRSWPATYKDRRKKYEELFGLRTKDGKPVSGPFDWLGRKSLKEGPSTQLLMQLVAGSVPRSTALSKPEQIERVLATLKQDDFIYLNHTAGVDMAGTVTFLGGLGGGKLELIQRSREISIDRVGDCLKLRTYFGHGAMLGGELGYGAPIGGSVVGGASGKGRRWTGVEIFFDEKTFAGGYAEMCRELARFLFDAHNNKIDMKFVLEHARSVGDYSQYQTDFGGGGEGFAGVDLEAGAWLGSASFKAGVGGLSEVVTSRKSRTVVEKDSVRHDVLTADRRIHAGELGVEAKLETPVPLGLGVGAFKGREWQAFKYTIHCTIKNKLGIVKSGFTLRLGYHKVSSGMTPKEKIERYRTELDKLFQFMPEARKLLKEGKMDAWLQELQQGVGDRDEHGRTFLGVEAGLKRGALIRLDRLGTELNRLTLLPKTRKNKKKIKDIYKQTQNILSNGDNYYPCTLLLNAIHEGAGKKKMLGNKAMIGQKYLASVSATAKPYTSDWHEWQYAIARLEMKEDMYSLALQNISRDKVDVLQEVISKDPMGQGDDGDMPVWNESQTRFYKDLEMFHKGVNNKISGQQFDKLHKLNSGQGVV